MRPLSLRAATVTCTRRPRMGVVFAPCCGNVFDITPSGTLSVVYSFNDTSGSAFEPFSGLTLATDGTFYGTTLAGGQFSRGTVFKITASGVPTTLYNFGACVSPC